MPNLRRLLLVARGIGGFLNVGYTMTADEVEFWQDQAALLDPLAYEWVDATSQTRSPSGTHYYLVNGWNLDSTGAGTTWFHREASVENALVIPDGGSIATSSVSGAYMYLCKPSLVTGSDARYTDDPRGLWFDRIMQLGTMTQYMLGAVNTGSGQVDSTFPSDFTYGMVVHASVHDLAWMGLLAVAGGVLNLQNEISDSGRIRFATRVLMPFTRSDFTKIRSQGASESEGRSTLGYVKLPGGW